MKKLIILFFISNFAIAGEPVKSGDEIKANIFNNSTFTIGDIKQSILTETEFQSLHGDCWVKMRGQSIAGSDLSTKTAGRTSPVNTLPDTSGKFLRDKDGLAANVGETQTDELKSHNHEITFIRMNISTGIDGTGSGFGVIGWGGNSGTLVSPVTNRYSPSDALGAIHDTGGSETRPTNMTVNMYVKINHICN